MTEKPAQPAERTAPGRPQPVTQTRQPPRRLAHHLLCPSPPRTRHRPQQSLKLGGKRLLGTAQPAAHPPHARVAVLTRGFGADAGSPGSQSCLQQGQLQIPIGAHTLRQHRVADLAPRAPHATNRLQLSLQIALVPTVPSQPSPSTLRIRTAQLGNCSTVHLLSILLAAQTGNTY